MVKFIFIFLFAASAFADVVINDESEIQAYIDKGETQHRFHLVPQSLLKKITKTSGGNIEVDFGGGRIGTIARREDPFTASTQGQIREISCMSSKYLTSCELNIPVLLSHWRLIWKAHPDAAKVGDMIVLESTPLEKQELPGLPTRHNPIRHNYTYLYEDKFETYKDVRPESDVFNKMTSPTMSCQSMDWAHKLSKDFGITNKSISVREWSTELMLQNPETGVAENTTFSSHFGIELGLTAKELTISHIDFMTAQNFGGAGLFFGDIVGWSLVKNKNTCDLAFAFDLGPLQNVFQESEKKVKDGALQIVPQIAEEILTDVVRNNFFISRPLQDITEATSELGLNVRLGIIAMQQPETRKTFTQKKQDGTTEKVEVVIVNHQIREVIP